MTVIVVYSGGMPFLKSSFGRTRGGRNQVVNLLTIAIAASLAGSSRISTAGQMGLVIPIPASTKTMTATVASSIPSK